MVEPSKQKSKSWDHYASNLDMVFFYSEPLVDKRGDIKKGDKMETNIYDNNDEIL